ncbi:hypothetical protein K7432_011071 [Basidiobolus ranarum]|uniref:Uncharacterized protein n=1 Tax=Basidiobolus ranarum TaxID=34480 RepID=A0ABR2VUG6_9FUNG
MGKVTYKKKSRTKFGIELAGAELQKDGWLGAWLTKIDLRVRNALNFLSKALLKLYQETVEKLRL